MDSRSRIVIICLVVIMAIAAVRTSADEKACTPAPEKLTGEREPLTILVAGKASRDCKVGYLPTIEAALTNLDGNRKPVTISVESDSKNVRPAHWRIAVRDSKGRELPQKPVPVRELGRPSQEYTMGYEESLLVRLRIADYVDIHVPDTYNVQILYHNEVAIADIKNTEGLTVCKSLPLKLEVSPINVEITEEDRKAARGYINQLPATGTVKVLGGSFNEDIYDFIAQESPCGRLLKLDWGAVPDLIDAALDPLLESGRRAQVLAILFTITHRHDPRTMPGVLGAFEYRHSGWITFGGPAHEGPFSYYSSSMSSQIFGADGVKEQRSSASSGPHPGTPSTPQMDKLTASADSGKIDEKAQIQFAERWRVWKENEYVRTKPHAATTRNATPTTDATAESEQSKAILKIEELGGRVTVDDKSPGSPVIAVRWFGRTGTDVGLAMLKGFPQLQSLDLDHTEVSDTVLGNLAGLPRLQSLDISHTKVTNSGLEHLKGLTKLQTLNLEWNQVNDAGLEHLKELTQLQSLNLMNTKVCGPGLVHLKGLTQLQTLNLKWNEVDDAGLANLGGNNQLQTLDLNRTKITDAGLDHLSRLDKLRTLDLSGTNVTDTGLIHVKGLSNLKLLDLSKTQITDAGLVHLESLSHLETLDLNETKVTSVGVKKLRKALPKSTVQWHPPALPAADEIREWNDSQLRAELEGRDLGGEHELLLLETVRRGGKDWKEFLTAREKSLNHLIENPKPALSDDDFLSRWRSVNNLELLTALRQVQNRRDPLRILFAGKLKQLFHLDEKLNLSLRITNLDEEKRAVHGFTVGGDYRTGRLARWRIEIRDEKGKLLPIISPFGLMGGGLSTNQTLDYGESWEAQLPLQSYVHIAAPGKYTLRVYYHNDVSIVDKKGIDDLICSCSEQMTLEVLPMRVRVADQERQNARNWISELPNVGPVKMAIGIAEPGKFLDQESAAGKLQRLYKSAVPDLIDAALEPNQKPEQRAWVLALLFAITEHNDPRGTHLFGGNEILGPFEYTGEGTGSSSGGKIDLEKQKAFAEQWRVWKTDHYYLIEKQP